MPFLLAVFMTAGAGTGFAVTCGTTTWQLTAGQTIPVGTLTVSNDLTKLYVTYKLDTVAQPNASFGTLHLWVGNDLANLPGGGNQRPPPGQLPYISPSDTLTEHTFAIDFTDLLIQDVTKVCPLTLFVVAHAEVNGVQTDGPGLSNETAFGGNVNPGDKPWWFYGAYSVCCDLGPPPVDVCRTAFGKGGWVFTTDKKSNPEGLPSLSLTKNRWGWAIKLAYPGTYDYPIWAGAGLNKTANGTKVGTVRVDWDGLNADSDDVGRAFRTDVGHLFRFKSAGRSD